MWAPAVYSPKTTVIPIIKVVSPHTALLKTQNLKLDVPLWVQFHSMAKVKSKPFGCFTLTICKQHLRAVRSDLHQLTQDRWENLQINWDSSLVFNGTKVQGLCRPLCLLEPWFYSPAVVLGLILLLIHPFRSFSSSADGKMSHDGQYAVREIHIAVKTSPRSQTLSSKKKLTFIRPLNTAASGQPAVWQIAFTSSSVGHCQGFSLINGLHIDVAWLSQLSWASLHLLWSFWSWPLGKPLPSWLFFHPFRLFLWFDSHI